MGTDHAPIMQRAGQRLQIFGGAEVKVQVIETGLPIAVIGFSVGSFARQLEGNGRYPDLRQAVSARCQD